MLLAVNPNTVVVVNPSMPRLSSFELTVPSGAWRSVMAEERRGKGEGTDLTASLCLSPSPHDGKQQGQPGATEPKTMCCGGTMGGLGRAVVLAFVLHGRPSRFFLNHPIVRTPPANGAFV